MAPRNRKKKPTRRSESGERSISSAGDGLRPKHADRDGEWPIVSGGWREAEVVRLAARQGGIVAYAQLIGLGITPSAIARALERGRLHRVHTGIYAIEPLQLLAARASVHAALLACGPSSAISHRAAAQIWGMAVADPSEVDVVIVGHGRGRRRPGIRAHRVTALARQDLRRRHGLLLTSPARTAFDLAAELSAREFERMLDDAIARRIVSRTALRDVLARNRGKPGTVALSRLVEEQTLSRSSGEKELLRLIQRAGLPAPETNARFGRFEVDFLWREEKVAVELDGYDFHSSRAALERDHAKDIALQGAGISTVRVTGRQLARQPELALAWVVSAYARRERGVA